MINFSKYTLREIQAIVQVLDLLTEDMPEEDIGFTVAMSYYHVARKYEEDIMCQHEHAMAMQQARDHTAAEAEKVNRIEEACIAGAPPAVANCILNNCGAQLLNCPVASPAEVPAADPPAPPDMFGWVGDALDDLCAAGEVEGHDNG